MSRRSTAKTCGALLWAVTAFFAGCAAVPLRAEQMRPAQSSEALKVLVFKSSDNPLLHVPLKGFLSRFKGEVQIYGNVTPKAAKEAMATVAREKPDFLFCLGDPATKMAVDNVPDLPVLFALVVNVDALGLAERPNFFGISLHQRPAVEFSQFRIILPKLSRVLAFYTPDIADAFIATARKDLGGLGIELDAVPARNQSEIESKYAEHIAEVDATWLIADAVTMNEATFAWLRDQSVLDKKPLLASLSEQFAKAGAFVSVSTDFTSVGSQAALLVRKVFKFDKTPGEIGIQFPVGGTLAVNLATAEAVGLEVPRELMPFVNRAYFDRPLP